MLLQAHFIAVNEFTKVEQIARAGHPGQWMDAETLSPAELAFVGTLRCRKDRSRSRCAGYNSMRGGAKSPTCAACARPRARVSSESAHLKEAQPPPVACRTVSTVVKQVADGDLSGLQAKPAAVDESGGRGPRAALKELQQVMPRENDRKLWVEQARVEAVLGSCPRSLKSLRSGLSAYIAFVGKTAGRRAVRKSLVWAADVCAPGKRQYFPPVLELLLAWSRLFRFAMPLSRSRERKTAVSFAAGITEPYAIMWAM